MSVIVPFESYVIRQEHAREVVSPAYDTLTPSQRYDFSQRHPRNYLNVIRSLEEFPNHIRPTQDEMLASNAAKLRELIESDAYIRTEKPCFFIYRLTVGAHVQTGLVADVPIEAYDTGVIKKHENTQHEKEDRLTRYQEVVGATSSPVCLAYGKGPEIGDLVHSLTRAAPVIDFMSDDGVAHTIWCIDDTTVQQELIARFEAVPVTYLTDGHHRCAAASRYASNMKAQNAAHTGKEPYNFLMVAFFPDTELRILPYNRCIKDLNGCTAEEFLKRLRQAFEVEPVDIEHAEPRRKQEMAMFLDDRWYRLTVKSHIVNADDPVSSLDVMILHDHIIEPLLGIDDPRADPGIKYVAGTSGLSELKARHLRSGWKIALAMYPTSIDELIAVADADKVMPPKSTCFDPKVRSGLFVRML